MPHQILTYTRMHMDGLAYPCRYANSACFYMHHTWHIKKKKEKRDGAREPDIKTFLNEILWRSVQQREDFDQPDPMINHQISSRTYNIIITNILSNKAVSHNWNIYTISFTTLVLRIIITTTNLQLWNNGCINLC